MAKNRKPIPKKLRFEVFKRDKFTCQYCGRMAPDAILEVDHIKPVAEGGTNEILNLITSCRDCNRGKGKTPLTENQALKKQQIALAELAEKREQTEMMLEWKKELVKYEKDQIEMISDYLGDVSDYTLTERGKARAKHLLRQFSMPEILEAIDISFYQYYDGSDRSWDEAWQKVGGICYNRRQNNGDL